MERENWFGEFIKHHRESRGWSTHEFARFIKAKGIEASQTTVYRWETGTQDPALNTAIAVMRICNMEPSFTDELGKTRAPENLPGGE